MNMSDLSDSEAEEFSLDSHSSDSESDSSSESFDEFLEKCIDGTSVLKVGDEKSVIFNFYKTLSMELSKTFSIEYLNVFCSIAHLMSNYRRVYNGILPTEIDFTKKSNCIAYLHRYAACHSSLVFNAVSNIFDSPPSELLSKLNKRTLNVVFLGGGPGNDLVGFLTALHGHPHNLINLDVTVVDKMSGWEDIFNATIESLRQGDGGNAGSVFKEVNVMTTFILADLKDSEGWNGTMQAKMENADIVFFVKTLSHIPDGEKLQVLRNVVTHMKDQSLLIYIDSPYPDGVFSSLGVYLRTVYQSGKRKYTMKHKDHAFGYTNIGSSSAAVKAFVRCDNYYSDFLEKLASHLRAIKNARIHQEKCFNP